MSTLRWIMLAGMVGLVLALLAVLGPGPTVTCTNVPSQSRILCIR